MSDKHMNTEEVMKALKISRITLYRWTKAGKIPFAKAGSTYRFKKEDIDNFLQGKPLASKPLDAIIAPSRHPLLITARDIEVWASHGNKVAEEVLPELVRRLLQASRKQAGLTEIHIPSGDSVSQPGWDGKVQASMPHTYIPLGASVWEMGTGEPQNKATSDYNKRLKNPLDVNPKETTFTFVTAQRWAEKDRWASDKKRGGEWASVRTLDANDLEAWLEVSPAVKRWFLGVLSRTQHGVADLETYWEEWRTETQPHFTTTLVIAERNEQQEAIQNQLKKTDDGVITVHASSIAEATAFVAASIMELPDEECSPILSSTLVITSQQAWDEIVASTDSLILIAAFESPERLAPAMSKGHRVVVLVDDAINDQDKGINLKAPKKDIVKKQLTDLGIPEKQAEQLALLGRHSLLSLWRRLAVSRAIQKPKWVDDGATLIPALLVGRWDESSDSDRQILGRLAGQSYEDYIEELERVRLKPDSPVGKIGGKWFIASKEDVWNLINGKITRKQIEQIISCAVDVLSEIDPAYTLPYDERWLANIHGKKPSYSADIRGSIADTLAFVAVRFDRKKIGELEGDIIAASVMNGVMDKAREDKTGHLWASLSGVLPLLAESAPAEFLTALEAELKVSPKKIKFIFQDEKDDTSFSSSSPHTGFLWALENLAWSTDFLMRASYALSRLDGIDPGGRLVNRPLGSLKDIFLSWHPGTSASVPQREEALESIIARYPETGWKTLLAILPDSHGFTTGTHNPKWREWKPEKLTVTYADLHQFMDAIAKLMLKNAGGNAARWADILENYDNLPPQIQDEVATTLADMPLDQLEGSGRTLLWDKLRDLISRHRRFAKQAWAIKKEQLDKLMPALSHLEPSDLIEKNRWLFGHHPDLPLEDDDDDKVWEKHEIEVSKARKNAVEAIYKSGGIDMLVKLNSQVESSHYLGVAVGQANIIDDSDFEKVLNLLDGKDVAQYFARGVVIGRFYPEGWQWAKDAIKNSDALKRPAALANFLNILPLSSKTWQIVDESSPVAQKHYWENVSAYGLHGDENYARLGEELLKADRPYTAIEALSLYVESAGGKPEVDLALRTFEKFIKSDPKKTGKIDLAMFSHHASKLLDYLYKQTLADKSRLAQIEWGLLPALRYNRKPKMLQKELANNPKFFAEVISWVYRRRGSKKKKLTPEEEARARLGYDLLDAWNLIPGTQGDTIDEKELMDWMVAARKLLEKNGRLEVGDQTIGKILAASPVDQDGVWPVVPIRNVIETLESDHVESGIRTAVYNNRGVTSRAIGEGGNQERMLAQKYDDYAKATKFKWPHTAYVLLKIADTWRREAERFDKEALEDEIE